MQFNVIIFFLKWLLKVLISSPLQCVDF